MANLDRSFLGQMTPQSIAGYLQRVSKALNSQISFGKTNLNDGAPVGGIPTADACNISCFKTTGTTPGVANTEFAVLHNLLWVPWHYFYTIDVGTIYQGPTTGTAWTAATTAGLDGKVFVKSTVANAAFTMIII